jgi:hypothetical protein
MDYDEPHLALNEKTPSNGQNDQLVHWWLLVHYGQINPHLDGTKDYSPPRAPHHNLILFTFKRTQGIIIL